MKQVLLVHTTWNDTDADQPYVTQVEPENMAPPSIGPGTPLSRAVEILQQLGWSAVGFEGHSESVADLEAGVVEQGASQTVYEFSR